VSQPTVGDIDFKPGDGAVALPITPDKANSVKLLAISDLHLDHRINRDALKALPRSPGDWLILGGDVCGSVKQLAETLGTLSEKFDQLIWVPGNHELWVDSRQPEASSVDKYNALVDVCGEFGVATPEDPYLLWEGDSEEGDSAPLLIAPLHLLYDYSFRPGHVSQDQAVAWARESGVVCRDEAQINPSPFESKQAWCQQRLDYTEMRLNQCPADIPLVLVNHFPLRYDLVRTMRIPRFSIWCGTRQTEQWHKKYHAKVVVSGHLHMRATDYRDGVRFEEVSLGYPRDWQQEKGMHAYLREILPGSSQQYDHAGPFWKFRI